MDFKISDIELYLIVVLAIFLWWFIRNTIKLYYGKKRRLKHLHKFAKEGEVESQVELGKHYQNGEIVDKSCQRAAYWYHRASLNGDSEAKEYLKKFKNKKGNIQC
jgi:TPR repeat protein